MIFNNFIKIYLDINLSIYYLYLDLEARPTDFQIEERFLRSAVDKFHARRYSQQFVSAMNF